MERLHRSVVWLEQCLAVLILVAILGTMFAQVVARYVFRAPFSWSEELSRLGLIWMTFLSAAYVMSQRRHLAVDLWATRCSALGRVRADLFVDAVVAFTCLLLFFGSLPFVWYVHPVGSPALGIAKSVWYGGVSLGLLLIACHSLVHAWAAWNGKSLTRSADSEIEESLHLKWDGASEDESTKRGPP
ncbi:MAG: TRAP transporter small permease [Planctomycetaceae bacterium]|nr:TRAP transporter small permease [Planctomycetaceae bacterium]